MSELVGEHAIQLLLVEDLQQALIHTDRGVVRVAPGGERVRTWVRADVHARLGHLVLRRQPVGKGVQHGRLVGRHLLRLRRSERQPVAKEVGGTVHHCGKHEPDNQAGAAKEQSATKHQDHREQRHQKEGLDPVHLFTVDCSHDASQSVIACRWLVNTSSGMLSRENAPTSSISVPALGTWPGSRRARYPIPTMLGAPRLRMWYTPSRPMISTSAAISSRHSRTAESAGCSSSLT